VLAVALQEEEESDTGSGSCGSSLPRVCGSYRLRVLVAPPSTEGRQSKAMRWIFGSSTVSALQKRPPSRER
jgi:hypothetical protein